MADNDDLDALLDEAMDIVDEQERTHQQQVKQQEAKLEADLQRALDEQGGAAGGGALETDVVKLFQSLVGRELGEEGDFTQFESFKTDVDKIIAMLEGNEDLQDSDKENLNRVKELMNVLEVDDDDKAKELLEKMKSDPISGLPDGPIDSSDWDASVKNCMGVLQQLSSTSVDANGGSTVAPTGPSTPSTAVTTAAAAAAAAESGLPDNLAEMLLTAILDPDFVEPIKMMRDAYGPYLAAKAETLSESERKSCEAQYAKTVEICEFLHEPVSKADEARVTRLLELMHEFSQLGEPPKDLPEYSPKNKPAEEAPPAPASE